MWGLAIQQISPAASHMAGHRRTLPNLLLFPAAPLEDVLASMVGVLHEFWPVSFLSNLNGLRLGLWLSTMRSEVGRILL